MPLPGLVSFSFDRLSIVYFDADTADSHRENVDVEVAEYDSSTNDSNEEEEVEDGGSHIFPELDRRSTFLLGATTRQWAKTQDQQQISDFLVYHQHDPTC